MSNISFSLDWLTCTFDWDGKTDPLKSVPLESNEYTEPSSKRSYTDTLTCDTHSVSFNPEHPEQKVMLQLTGLQFDAFRKAGGCEKTLMGQCVEKRGIFKRVDYAVDLFDTEGLPHDVKLAWECSQLLTIAKQVGLIEYSTREESKGATVYIGSRSSERMVRIYDKAKQKGLKIDWLRVELEAKGDRANQLGHLISTRGVITAGNSMLADVIEWSDIPWLNAIWTGDFDIIDINAIGRPETDRDKWLRTVVVPVVETELAQGNAWLLSALITLIDANEGKSQHGPHLSPTPQ